MKTTRRRCLTGTASLVALEVAPQPLLASPSAQTQRLENRLELWSTFASKTTENLVARMTSRRETSLLEEPHTTTGTLAFIVSPPTLVLRDDGLEGSRTFITDDAVEVRTRQPRGARDATQRRDHPTADWLAHILLRCFSPPRRAEDLLEGTRFHVPKGRGYRLELMPPRGSRVRQSIRSLALHLDPTGGAITSLVLSEAQGDRWTLRLSDHRQNVDAEDIARWVSRDDP